MWKSLPLQISTEVAVPARLKLPVIFHPEILPLVAYNFAKLKGFRMEIFCIRCLRTAECFREFPVGLLLRMRFRKYMLVCDTDSCSNLIK